MGEGRGHTAQRHTAESKFTLTFKQALNLFVVYVFCAYGIFKECCGENGPIW